ncbi:stage II sporulation protein R [Intestinibacter sp.]|uniref:stage II sporulation protein R n=1 Tax=Intestinibacter sp. TaxID=1965304 RepID=UPI002A91A08C|nr:stage II sporulation protein R [Intestinibacter sp.]MDY5211061.1 stage II sporulation protein R [Intestinibacter sp.]
MKNNNNSIRNILKINRNIKFRIILCSVMLFLVLGIMATCAYAQISKIDKFSDDYKDNLIRFHVLANSDSDEDQALKLKVRDEVISYLQPKLKDSESIKESEQIILKEENNLMDICKKTIKENGYDYDVNINLGYSKFPTKQYSSVVLPAGEYKALKIVIGKGQGRNWWCVMFPPLCFVDEQNNVIDKETDEKLKSVLTKDEYELIVEKDNKKVNDLQIKFKIVEVFQKILDLKKEGLIDINS